MAVSEILLGYATEDKNRGPGVYPVSLDLKRANRHGLIAGATGTGKTVSMQALAESFSRQGVPVLVADVKGDLSGISQPGKSHPKVEERLAALGLPLDAWHGNPTVFWDLYRKQGHPLRATVSDMGPMLLARLLGLNDTQQGVLNIVFAVADDNGLLLLDLKDLRSMLTHVAESAGELDSTYGRVSASSVGAIQRRLLVLERSGAKHFFGEPMLELDDLMRVDSRGAGYVNVLVADKLVQQPAMYSTVLLWLLSELFENLPEIGDPEKPRLVIFFDEAHLLFKNTSPALVEKIEQVVRLIRSKGVGVYFVTQSPGDLPDAVLGQLGNRIQHALRAFTPKERRAVRAAAQTFRSDGSFAVEKAIGELGVGEALISTLLANGAPSMVRRALVKPPVSRIGPARKGEIYEIMLESELADKYSTGIDRESAFEKLAARAAAAAATAEERKPSRKRAYTEREPRRRSRQGIGEALVKSAARSIGSGIGRAIMRGILGSVFKGR